MERLRLVGWTADLAHVVLGDGEDDGGDGAPTHRVELDDETVDGLLQLLEAMGLAVVDAEALDRDRAGRRAAARTDRRTSGWGGRTRRGALGAPAGTTRVTTAPPPAGDEPRLSPGEVQRELRAGRTVAAVARDAGVDVEWVARWEGPIIAERQQVLAAAQAQSLELVGGGVSALPLGRAVRQQLVEAGVDLATLDWRVARRSDGRWKVSAVYEDDLRRRTASWRFDLATSRLGALGDLAAEIGHTDRRSAPPEDAEPDATADQGSTEPGDG